MVLSCSTTGSFSPLVIIVDDALSIGNSKDYTEGFTSSVVRCVTEGPKVQISVIVASHNWQADSMPKQFRSNFDWRVAFRCESSESHLLFQDRKNKYANLTPDLVSGECMLLDNTNDIHTLQGPRWDSETLQRMSSGAKVVPPIVERFELPKDYSWHVVDGGKVA